MNEVPNQRNLHYVSAFKGNCRHTERLFHEVEDAIDLAVGLIETRATHSLFSESYNNHMHRRRVSGDWGLSPQNI